MSAALAAHLRLKREGEVLDGRLRVTRWELDVATPQATSALAAALGGAYVTPQMQWEYPDASAGPRLPGKDSTTRPGDFGEVLAGALYSGRLGRDVPFQRLTAKPVAGATQQGADLLALTIDHGRHPTPCLVEVKTRETLAPAAILKALRDSLANIDDDYLVSAWIAGVNLMLAHPDHAKLFALTAAQNLAQLTSPGEPCPPHLRHAVVIDGGGELLPSKVTEHWGANPPVSELHLIHVPDLKQTIKAAYTAAGLLSYSDLASGAPATVAPAKHVPGLAAPISSSEAQAAAQLVERDATGGSAALIESSLWHLADWDGMGSARARLIRDSDASPAVRALAAVLSGAPGYARREFSEQRALIRLADAVRDEWAEDDDPFRESISSALDACLEDLDDDTATAAKYVVAAIQHRLPRHPRRLVAAAGATGATVAHVIAGWGRVGIHALWPSQAQAVHAGLLDQGHPSLVIKMPTSAGKTALIELLVADTLDSYDPAVIAVLAPTKALVNQLTRDVRRHLPDHTAVRSSHGGLDFDTEEPGAAGILTDPGVSVVTPERFDLEWRRVATGDNATSTDNLRLIIVDEAHLLSASQRGARLELLLARALRRGVRVVLVSSQFPQTDQLASWLRGNRIESDWTPTWLQRFVYFHSPCDKTAGMLQEEVGEPTRALQLRYGRGSEGCARERPNEAAALASERQGDGLVVIFSNERARIEKLVAAAEDAFGASDPADSRLKKIADDIVTSDPDYARLLTIGIGVHHANVPRRVRQAVESAARQNLLRCIVCTPTLLEGVDFPTRVVVAAYPPWTKGVPEIARLRNLEGRAGRGGKVTSGSLIVMAKDQKKAQRWLTAFRSALPPTTSALTDALNHLQALAQSNDLIDPLAVDENGTLASIDAVILAAIAEGAVADGDLRQALEDLLGRTLWYVGTDAARRDYILTAAVRRANFVVSAMGGDMWQRAIYRTGLPVASAFAVREALAPHLAALTASVERDPTDPAADYDSWLVWLACFIAPSAEELHAWKDYSEANLRDAVSRWLRGEPVDQIEAIHGGLWDVVEPALETLVPWVVTAAIEFLATATGRPELRELAHRRLAVSRLRYGVPDQDLCDVVRGGADRVLVSSLYAEYRAVPAPERLRIDLATYIADGIAAEQAEDTEPDTDVGDLDATPSTGETATGP